MFFLSLVSRRERRYHLSVWITAGTDDDIQCCDQDDVLSLSSFTQHLSWLSTRRTTTERLFSSPPTLFFQFVARRFNLSFSLLLSSRDDAVVSQSRQLYISQMSFTPGNSGLRMCARESVYAAWTFGGARDLVPNQLYFRYTFFI